MTRQEWTDWRSHCPSLFNPVREGVVAGKNKQQAATLCETSDLSPPITLRVPNNGTAPVLVQNQVMNAKSKDKQENLVQQTYNTIQTTSTSSSGLQVFSLSIHFEIDQLFVYNLLKNCEMSVRAQGDISSPKLRYPVEKDEKETEKKQQILM